jgi:FkbM family methyltransferase
MTAIREWLAAHLTGPAPKVILELGAHCGDDTGWLASLPGATVHAFEPDPRNVVPPLPNVVFTRAAVSANDGVAPFRTSTAFAGHPWTYSGSLREPTGHLQRWPSVTFGDVIQVRTVTLDTYAREHGLDLVDFVWCDVQGAEGDVIEGGRATLARTRFLYTETSDEEWYAGQPTLARLLKLLPGWRVVERYPTDVLLENPHLKGSD